MRDEWREWLFAQFEEILDDDNGQELFLQGTLEQLAWKMKDINMTEQGEMC